ncbi:type II and III secretion system protein [Rhodopirellula sp. JC740]|uniref:Type II and III secretion system protein n=1 Tax=Rhodopirellula halodulae TaxID=2894198 RepID=A0ABS8NH57_9BACT|nr:type II and III secretion system protein [Rhodopirellula sp. JC740]MCC9642163.1 type II and III secretion system protein [Rhodopirellula sp. JC740]
MMGIFLTFLLSGCVYRPDFHRTSIDELIQQSLDHSNAERGGDPDMVGNVSEPVLVDESFGIPQDNMDLQYGTDQEIPKYQNDWSVDGYSEWQPDRRGDDLIPIQQAAFVQDASGWNDTPNDEFLIQEEFIETDVREVLTLLAADAELDLVLDDNVSGIVNAQINDLTIDEAVEKVLLPLGLASTRRGRQLIVAPPDPASPLFPLVSVKHRYQPAHMDPNTLLETVPVAWLQYVTVVEQAKTMLVEAPPTIANDIIERFQTIDQPIPQVVLEAIICVVSPDSGFQFGLDWQHAVEMEGVKRLSLSASGLALNGEVSQAGLDAIFSDFGSTSAFVKLLSEKGYLTIRATPHVMAKDGEQANIAINRETFFSVQPPGSTGNNSVFFQQDIQKVDAGIVLDITPHIRGDEVTIEIEKAEVSEDVRNATTQLSINQYPIINRRSVSTTVNVKDGKTIVIGGLVQRETVDRVNRIPGLSRLPGVGKLFQTTERQTRDAEVVIFISPRIVRSTDTAIITSGG